MAYLSVTLDRTEQAELNSEDDSVSSARDQSRSETAFLRRKVARHREGDITPC